jgi:hypothetical protein
MTQAQAIRHRSRRRVIGALAAFTAAFTAVSAYGGAAGLVTGFLATDSTLDSRLPFASPVFGGIALACIVGVPSTLLAVHASRSDESFGRVAVVVGTLLVGWIGVELAFIRELSFFHPIYAAIGVVFVRAGLAVRRS